MELTELMTPKQLEQMKALRAELERRQEAEQAWEASRREQYLPIVQGLVGA